MITHDAVISAGALKDIEEIWRYISYVLQEPDSADEIANMLFNTISTLRVFPLRNRAIAIFPDGRRLRRANAGNYVVLYVVNKETVFVLSIEYGRRNLDKRISRILREE